MSDPHVLRVGIVGASVSGSWAMQSHVPAVQGLPGMHLEAIATTRTQTARDTAARVGVAGAYTDVRALAEDPTVDLVTVAVKVPAHYDAVVAVIEAGKDVYCEWPLGVDTSQARALRDLAVGRGVRHYVGLQARVSPILQRVRDLLAEGFLGRLLSVRLFSAGFGLGGPQLPADREWAADKGAGLSVLTVRTAHTVDALAHSVAPIESLSAEVVVATPYPLIAGTTRTVRKTAPDQVVLSGRLLGGASLSGQFLLGVEPQPTPLLTLLGSEGTLSVVPDEADGQIQMSALTLWGARGREAPRQLALPAGYSRVPDDIQPGPAASVAHLYAVIRDARTDSGSGGMAPPEFHDAVRLHELLDTIDRAATTGRKQLVSH